MARVITGAVEIAYDATGEPRSMLTQEEDVEAHHLKQRGCSISAVARHLGRDRKTIGGPSESRNHFIAQRFWRSAQVGEMADAQAKLDRFLATTGHARRRDGMSVGEIARDRAPD